MNYDCIKQVLLQEGKIERGALFVVVIIIMLMFTAYIFVGGTLPTKLPGLNDNLVVVVPPKSNPARSNLQLYTFYGATITPVPPPPSGAPNFTLTPSGITGGNPNPANLDSPYGFTNRAKLDATLIQEYKDLNVHWLRDQMLWQWAETAPGVYDWSQIDQQVQLANANHIHIVYVIQSAPDWHRLTCPSDGAKYEFDVPGVTQFATALASRYNGQNGHGFIDSYEIGNEDFDIHFAGSMAASAPCRSPSTYVPVLKAAYQAIKSQSPSALVGMFGMWLEDKQAEQDFLNGMYALDPNIGKYFDYGNFHFYNGSSPPDQPASANHPTFNERWQIMANVFAAHGDANKPIWVTEVGWPTNGLKGGGFVTPQQQAQYLQYVMDQSRLSGVVKKVFWYSINWDKSDNIAPNGSPLPAYNTYKSYVAQHPTW